MASSEVAGGQSILAAKINEITVGTTQPATPVTGNLWMDTNTAPAIVKTYNGASWVAAAVQPSLFTVAGQMLYSSGAGAVAVLGVGSADQILRFNGSIPQWYTPVGGATPNINTANGSPGVSTVFARGDHAHPDNIITANGTSAGFSITLSTIPGFAGACRILISISNAPSSGNVVATINSISAGVYIVNNLRESGGSNVNPNTTAVGTATADSVIGFGAAGQTSLLINSVGAAQHHQIELTLYDDGIGTTIHGIDMTANGVIYFSCTSNITPATSLQIGWTGSSVWSYRAMAA